MGLCAESRNAYRFKDESFFLGIADKKSGKILQTTKFGLAKEQDFNEHFLFDAKLINSEMNVVFWISEEQQVIWGDWEVAPQAFADRIWSQIIPANKTKKTIRMQVDKSKTINFHKRTIIPLEQIDREFYNSDSVADDDDDDDEVWKHTEILFHDIMYNYDNGMDLPEEEEEHIKQMINEGYREGELVYFMSDSEDETRGWWKINFNRGE